MMIKKSTILILLLFIGALTTACGGSSAARLNKNGNDQFYKAAYDEAWGLYQSAQIENPELAAPYYNAANALYKQGLYEEALTQMGMALQFADEETITEQSFFNMGNTSFNLQDMETAVSSYIEALLRNPNDTDAKHNLELALAQQQEQQQEQEQQEQEQQDEQENQGDSEGDKSDQEQESEGQEGEKESEESQEGKGENAEDQSKEQEGENGQEGEKSENGEPSNPQGGQEDEGQQEGQQGELTGEPGSEEPNGSGYTPAPGELMTEDQAEQLLAAIAGGSQTLQEALGQIMMVPGGRPPVQDW